MDDARIFLETGNEVDVKGIFYIYNSNYYFMYTTGEVLDSDYTQLYIVKVFKEIQNTQTGQVDTGYLMGVEMTDQNEWVNIQKSITKIVEDKKNNTVSSEIQYLPINMLTKLKIVSKNKFKLMTQLLNDSFNLNIYTADVQQNNVTNEIQQPVNNETESLVPTTTNEDMIVSTPGEVISASNPIDISQAQSADTLIEESNNGLANDLNDDVIVDYRAKFFEEQDKNKELEERIKQLEEKINNIRKVIE